jgi:Xaa-Pro aminopeptidase
MDDVLIFADTERSPEMRRELPLGVTDPFLYAEVGGARHVVIPHLEIARLAAADTGAVLHPTDEFGSHELVQQGLGHDEVLEQVAVRFCRELDIRRAVVPGAFPVRMADVLRDAGIEIEPRQSLFSGRRRVKTPVQIEGIRRAQRAAEAGMAAVADLIARAEPRDDGAVVDGAPLTSERLRQVLLVTFLEHGAVANRVIASHGSQAAEGHESGSGVILPGEPVIVDIWPHDLQTGCYTDMTRTFVVGEPPAELALYQKVVKDALDASIAEVRPGADTRTVYGAAAGVIEQAGYPTNRTKQPGKPLDHGFYHPLGHGVGLHVHEAPVLGIRPDTLVAGDVIAVEPGIYRPGFGGCRLEDILVVTDEGADVLTTFPYDVIPSPTPQIYPVKTGQN